MPVIFDFDGVIADTEKLHFAASREVLTRLGVALDEAAYYAKYLGYSDQRMAEALGVDPARFIAEKGLVYDTLLGSGAILFPGAAACIARLAADAGPIAIASGAFREEIEHILDGAGLRQHFHTIVGARDASHSKPHPAPYLEAARRLQADPSECVVIEDSMWGLDAARAAGMKTIAVTHTYPRQHLTADVIVDRLDEITVELVTTVVAP